MALVRGGIRYEESGVDGDDSKVSDSKLFFWLNWIFCMVHR